jgi:RNA polymerase sigma-70 factor (ECF subfamily)
MKIAEEKISRQDEDKSLVAILKYEKSSSRQEDESLVAILKDEKSPSRQKESAFNQLYAKHQKAIGFYILRNINNSEDAEDLKMLTFEKVHQYIKYYDDKFAFSTWMYKIALNCLIDFKRKANLMVISTENINFNADTYENFLSINQIKSDDFNPEQKIIRDEKVKLVQEAIESLDNQFIKELMTERFINDLTFEQISEKIGIENNSTLRVNILRGKEILKSKLSKINPYK